jgi:hypothetical protein
MDMSRSRWLQLKRLAFHSRLTIAALFITLFQPLYAQAFDFTDAEITEENGVFRIKVSAFLEAPPDYIRYVLADSAHIYRLSPSIIESEVLSSSPAGEKRVRTKLLSCTAVFCREVERVDIVRMLQSGGFEAEIIPDLSEFKYGKATWEIIPIDDASYVVYEAYLEPDFFIPPVLGSQIVKQYLLDEFTTTFIRMERIAGFNAEKDRNAEYMVSDAASRTLKAPCWQNANASASLQ